MSKILCFGEILVDFLAKGTPRSLGEAVHFEKFTGGAAANTALALGRLGTEAAMLGAVGDDPFGKELKKYLKDFGVKTQYMQIIKDRPTAVVFVSLNSAKEPTFHSFGGGVAYNYFRTDKKSLALIRQAKAFHFTSIPIVEEGYRKETIKALEAAKKSDVITSFDVNIRLHLFRNEKTAKKILKEFIPYADVLKFGKDELRFLFGKGKEEKICERLAGQGGKLIFVTDGDKRCSYYFKGRMDKVKAFRVTTEDTTGAGDAFIAGVLSRMVSFENVEQISAKEMKGVVRFASAVAAMSTTRKGATTALPTKMEVKRFLSQKL